MVDPLRDTKVGRRKRDAIMLIIEIVLKCAADLINQLRSRMEHQVYKEENMKIIKITGVWLEAKSLMQSVVSRGASTVANLTFDRIPASAVELDCELLKSAGKQ